MGSSCVVPVAYNNFSEIFPAWLMTELNLILGCQPTAGFSKVN